MKIQFLGTAAAEGCPALFCKCSYCEQLRSSGHSELFRTRSQALINDDHLVDFPPDTFLHFWRNPSLDLSLVHHILITHSHEDNFYPEDILLYGPCFSTTLQEPLSIYGNSTVISRLRSYVENAPAYYHSKEYIQLHQLQPFETVSVNGYEVTPVLADHDRAEECYLYVIQRKNQTILYGNDTGIKLCSQTWETLGRFHYDLVSLDCTACTRDVPQGHHMGIPNNLEFASKLDDMNCISQFTQFVITHFSHHYSPFQENLEAELPSSQWHVAFDGMSIKF